MHACLMLHLSSIIYVALKVWKQFLRYRFNATLQLHASSSAIIVELELELEFECHPLVFENY